MGFIPPLIATIGSVAGSAGGAIGATAGAASASGSILSGVASATSLIGSGIGLVKSLTPPKLPPPPATPALSSTLTQRALVGPYEGSANGTLVSGTNQRGGASKTLLGQ